MHRACICLLSDPGPTTNWLMSAVFHQEAHSVSVIFTSVNSCEHVHADEQVKYVTLGSIWFMLYHQGDRRN